MSPFNIISFRTGENCVGDKQKQHRLRITVGKKTPNIFLLINFIRHNYLFAKVTHRTLIGCSDQQRVRSCSGSGTSTSRCAIGWGGKSGRWGQKSPPSQVECRWSWTTGCSLAWKGRRQREGGVICDTVAMIETSFINNSVCLHESTVFW